MAVHTILSDSDFIDILTNYSLGSFISATAISEGIENSNFFLTSTQGDFVLTLFEEIPTEELTPYLEFLHFLQSRNIAVAAPIQTNSEKFFLHLNKLQKPIIISPKLLGSHPHCPNHDQCINIASELAQLHIVSQSYTKPFEGIRSSLWLHDLFTQQADKLSVTEKNKFQRWLNEYLMLDLPKSMTHGDLFTDNCIFNQDELSGIIDFFNAGFGPMLFDLSVLINAWATESGVVNKDKIKAIINAYQSVRVLEPIEKEHLVLTLKIAAMRFYLSRLAVASTKKPEELRLLLDYLEQVDI